jgi:alpha-D-ribose 1-methylphosphonate 5-triphosphate synthase subunit PhnH
MMHEPLSLDLAAWSSPQQQIVFRQLLRAFSFPGRIQTLVDTTVFTHTLAVLVDRETTLADPQHLLDALTLKRLQARRTTPELAQFIVADGSLPPTFEPRLGTLESPEYGATILLKVAVLGHGNRWQLTGPGIATTGELATTGLHPDWLLQRQIWNAGFPLGVDLILLDANSLVALPRTTSVTAMATTGDTPWAM